MAKGCQRNENNFSGSTFSIHISIFLPSYAFCLAATSAFTLVGVIDPPIFFPGANVPSNFIPNQVPNSFESLIARQTLARGARSKIFFSIRSVVVVFMRNLQVAG